MSPVQGQANDASNVIRKWCDTAEETAVVLRADTSNPWKRSRLQSVTTRISRFLNKLNEVRNRVAEKLYLEC